MTGERNLSTASVRNEKSHNHVPRKGTNDITGHHKGNYKRIRLKEFDKNAIRGEGSTQNANQTPGSLESRNARGGEKQQ